MNISQSFAVMSVMNKYRAEKFEWGMFDCNTFIVDIYDVLCKTNEIGDIRGKYHDKGTAIRFHESIGGAEKWLSERGFVEAIGEPKTGDVVTSDIRFYTSVYLYFDGIALSMVEGKDGLHGFDVDSIRNRKVWRKQWEH